MKKLGFWKADWFLGLMAAVVILIAARGDLIRSLERKAYDLGAQAATRASPDRSLAGSMRRAGNVVLVLKAGLAAMLSLAIGGALLGAHFGLMALQLTWFQLMGSVVLLAVGYAALTTKRFLATECGKEKSDAESAESSRMPGIAHQAQEQLDLAWDKFRQCPSAWRWSPTRCWQRIRTSATRAGHRWPRPSGCAWVH